MPIELKKDQTVVIVHHEGRRSGGKIAQVYKPGPIFTFVLLPGGELRGVENAYLVELGQPVMALAE